jgi:hypothetical protein
METDRQGWRCSVGPLLEILVNARDVWCRSTEVNGGEPGGNGRRRFEPCRQIVGIKAAHVRPWPGFTLLPLPFGFASEAVSSHRHVCSGRKRDRVDRLG